jgi:transcriptional regulator with XRE-family HTH domain
VELRDRIKALRKALGLTQEALAERADLERVEISNLESGRNQATSVRILKGLARGFGLELQDASDLVDGVLDVETAVQRSQARPPDPRSARDLAAGLAREIGVSEHAIAAVLAEPIASDRETWPALWWADAMRRRELDLFPRTAPEPARSPAPPDKHAARGRGGRG